MNLQLFASHTIDVDLMPDEPVVLDVGCRWFDFTSQIVERWPRARVIAMDPARDVIEGPQGAICSTEYLQVGLVGHGPTFQRFAHFSTGEGDFITTLDRFHDAEMYVVPTMKIKDVMKLRQVQHFDLVKLDCEGSEFGILENWPGRIATQISVEMHDWDKPQYRSETYHDSLLLKLPWYKRVKHDLSVQGTGLGHWDDLWVLR